VPRNQTQPATMLVITREPSALQSLFSLGQQNSWHLERANSGWEALERVQAGGAFDLVVLDLARRDGEGLHTLRWLRRVRPDMPVVLVAYPEDVDHRLEAIQLGVHEYLVRPVKKEQLEDAIERSLGKSGSNHQPLHANTEEVEQISDDLFFVAASPVMRKLRTQAELVAQINVPVLIVGESGSGKEVVARLIHKLSIRSGFPFLKMNCEALPSDLLESELFGYERGAFTGAIRTKAGKFELCEKGTILLDEIAGMPTSVQTKLLHVLQDRQFFRLGGQAAIKADVRILAATGSDVDNALSEKRLREDLYYLLSAFTIHVPALRQRTEEIPLLMGHFMQRLAKHFNLPTRVFPPTILDACESYAWPGNLRELQNFVKRYLVIGDDEVALSELRRSNGNGIHALEPPSENAGDETANGLKFFVQSVKGEAEKSAIAAALDQTRWNRKAAARLLKVSYRTLLYKIEHYHMSPPAYLSPYTAASAGNGQKGNGHAS
jgi:two-component system, NtrC family, response regulator AtoC